MGHDWSKDIYGRFRCIRCFMMYDPEYQEESKIECLADNWQPTRPNTLDTSKSIGKPNLTDTAGGK